MSTGRPPRPLKASHVRWALKTAMAQNKIGKAALCEIEYQKSRKAGVGQKTIEVYSISDILAIHKYLFQDVYAWAGQYRKVNISKSGNPFMPIQSFSTAQDYINHLIHTYYQTANSKNKIIKQLAKILDNLNYFHPFREGNGRTQREVIRSLALSKGYSAQIRVEQDDEVYNLYMDGTVYGDLGKLEELLGKILEKL